MDHYTIARKNLPLISNTEHFHHYSNTIFRYRNDAWKVWISRSIYWQHLSFLSAAEPSWPQRRQLYYLAAQHMRLGFHHYLIHLHPKQLHKGLQSSWVVWKWLAPRQHWSVWKMAMFRFFLYIFGCKKKKRPHWMKRKIVMWLWLHCLINSECLRRRGEQHQYGLSCLSHESPDHGTQ